MAHKAPLRHSSLLVAILLMAACDGQDAELSLRASPTGETPATVQRPAAQAAYTETPRGEATSTPDPRLAVVSSYILPESLSWSPDSNWLAYATSEGRVWLRRSGEEESIELVEVQAAPPAWLTPSWSSEGNRLVVYGVWGFDYPLWTGMWLVGVGPEGVEYARTLVEPFRPDPPVYQNEGVIYSASWSADGQRIAYTIFGEAWVYDLAEDSHRQLTRLTKEPIAREEAIESFDGVREVAWSPDDRWLALGLSCNCPSPYSGVAALGVSSGEVRLLADGAGRVSWSPNGRWIILKNVSGDWGPEYTYDFYGADPATGELVNLTRSNPDFDPLLDGYDHFRPGTYQVSSLEWGPEGRYLYTVEDYILGDAGIQDRPAVGFVARADPDSTLIERFPNSDAWFAFPDYLQDGRVAFIEVEPQYADFPDSGWPILETRDLVIDDRRVPLDIPQIHWAAWAPDGSQLALLIQLGTGTFENELRVITTTQ